MIKLFIFDMDGLMFETGRLAYRAYLEAAKEYDFEMVHGVYYYLTGRVEEGIVQAMKELYGDNQDVMTWRQAINIHRNAILDREKRVYKKKGLTELLVYAKEQGVKTAVASSSERWKINHYLEIEGILPYIDYTIAGDEVKKGKPDGEIFLTACTKAGIQPDQAMVFEDSAVGIQASRAAGIRSCLVPDDITDMPIYQGTHRLHMDMTEYGRENHSSDFSFTSLLEAKEFLKQNNLQP